MLDQNTDRMWYVIGAVLIGAAIIFGMNTLMPNTFASVNWWEYSGLYGHNFRIGVLVGPRKNYLLDASAPKSSSGTYIDCVIDMATFNELKGETVTLSFDARSETEHMQEIDVYFRVYNNEDILENLVTELSDGYFITDSYQRFSHTMVVPDFTAMVDYPLTIRIRQNNASVSGFIRHTDAEENGHISINNTDPFTTRRVKLELGTNDSGWVSHDDDEI